MVNRGRILSTGAGVLMIGLAILALPGFAGAEEGVPVQPPLAAVGEAAPLFEADDTAGKTFVLQEELTRGPVFLVFWSIF